MSKMEMRNGYPVGRWLGGTAMILALSLGVAPTQAAVQAQAAAQVEIAAQAVAAARQAAVELTYALSSTPWGGGAEGAQVPQDIRIMQRILGTALGEVEPPELPAVLEEEVGPEGASAPYAYSFSGSEVTSVRLRAGRATFGGSTVTGFYMRGYGYLFTVKWPMTMSHLVGAAAREERSVQLEMLAAEARRAAGAGRSEASRAAGEAEKALDQQRVKLQEQREAWDRWSAQYRDRLADALRGVVATYGSTLNRARPEESITFIADFGGGEAETVTLSVRRGQLTGASREQNLAAVMLAKGETGVSDALRTELKIMAAIIDGSLQGEGTGEWAVVYSGQGWHSGDSAYQYVPGYGVLFRKAARLNLATRVIRQVATPSGAGGEISVQGLRQRIDESTEEQRQVYSEHLANLKQQTAEILATYGPTLTEMSDDEWVGVYYDVGSAAGLLEGGISNFLVQARMGDIRQAANQADGPDWLLGRLVTNEKQE